MNHMTGVKIIGFGLLVLLVHSVIVSGVAQAQGPTPFLISPYFEKEEISQAYHSGHRAIDFRMRYKRVLAAAGGTVELVDWANDNCHQSATQSNCSYGLYALINHGNGFRTLYAHLSTVAFDLETTHAPIKQGQIIGTSGHTGWSTGPHLHFEVIDEQWIRVNPSDYNGVSLWIDGWIDPAYYPAQNPNRPIPVPVEGGTVIVDDQDAGFTKGCADSPNCPFWYSVNDGYNNHYWWTNVWIPEDYWARWTPSLPHLGTYGVHIHIPPPMSNINASTWQARYQVNHFSSQQQTTVVSQLGLPHPQWPTSQWVSVGTYPMAADANNYVQVTDFTGEELYEHCYNATGSAFELERCRLAVDAVKFVRQGTTYLADVGTKDGWASNITIRSNGGTASTDELFFGENGGLSCRTGSDIPGHGAETWPTCAGWSSRSAVIDATHHSASAVENYHDGNGLVAAYTGQSPATTIAYLPAFYNHTNISSIFSVQNAAAVPSLVTLEYWDRDGVFKGSRSVNISAHGSRRFDPYNCDPYNPPPGIPGTICGSGFDDGSVKITAAQSFAVVSTNLWRSGGAPFRAGQYNAATQGRTELYAPSQYRVCTDSSCSSWVLFSAIVLNNLTNSPANVTLDYRPRQDGGPSLTINHTIPAFSARGFNTRGGGSVPASTFDPLGHEWDGTVYITADQNIAGVVNTIWAQANTAGTYSLAGQEDAQEILYMPLQRRKCDTNCQNWQRWSAINIMNISNTSVPVTVRYYHQNGALAMDPVTFDLPAEEARGLNTRGGGDFPAWLFAPLGNDFEGSAMITTNSPALIAIGNLRYLGPNRAAIYNGIE